MPRLRFPAISGVESPAGEQRHVIGTEKIARSKTTCSAPTSEGAFESRLAKKIKMLLRLQYALQTVILLQHLRQ